MDCTVHGVAKSWTQLNDLSFSLRIDSFAVQGTPKSLLQHHNSKASIIQHLAFFVVQFSHLYMTTGRTITLNFFGKMMSLLFNTLSTIVIASLSRSKHLLISWLQSPFATILENKKIKSVTASTFPPSIHHDIM